MISDKKLLVAIKALFAIGRPIRVLIAEDHVALSRMITMSLQHCGFEVRTLNDGSLVLTLVRSFRPHFLLLDLGLPVMNGYDVAEQIRSDSSLNETKIIVISAYGPEMYPARSRKARIDRHLTKPVDLDDLLAVMTTMIFE